MKHKAKIDEGYSNLVEMGLMPKGSFGIIRQWGDPHNGEIVKRCGDHIFDIDGDNSFWGKHCTIKVELIKPGSVITITVG